jgi:uncharacterized protein YdeI (BOF family)|tara:strand:- start:2149 stop:2337 length:189 start_codon:yes stop_codon:yes gene_type:complete
MSLKKIFITSFVWDQAEYEGPDIHADTLEQAKLIAESQGLILDGELVDLITMHDETRPRVLH